MSENKFIKRLKGEQTAKSVLEIKNESAKTSFANMPQGTSNAIDVFSDHRGNATAVLNGTTNWKVSNSDLLLADAVSGDGQDFTSTYSVSGSGLWVNASYTFPSTGDPRHPVAMVFNPSTKWVLKVCGDNLIVDGGSTVDFTMLVKIGTASVYSKNFTIRESAGQFSKEFIIDFGEANSDVVKAGGLSTLTVQLLCGTANASARIYNGMTVLTCLQRKVDASAVSNSSANVEDVLDGNIIPSDYFSNPAFIDQIEDGDTAVAIFARDGDDVNLDHWEQPIPARTGNAGKFLQTPDGDGMSWKNVEISDVTGLQTALDLKADKSTTYTKTETDTLLSGKQDTISDLATIRSNAQAGKAASDTIATYGDIVTHDVAEFATAAQGAKADTALQAGDNVSELANDAGYLVMGDLTNFVTKNTAQTISGLKTFSADITLSGTTSIKNTTNGISYTMLYRDASGIHVGTSTQALLLAGSNARPKFNNNDIAMLSDIPTAVSQLTNDTGFITSSALAPYALSADLATVATTGSYSDLSGTPTIGNATLTIQKNSVAVDTFTANATVDKSINITVPVNAADVNALPNTTKYVANASMTIDNTTYVVTLQLKDQDGNNIGTAQTVDLPLESVVVSGAYDSVNKKIVLTLKDGSTIDIPVGDLVAGLQAEITSTNKLDADLVDDSTSTNKFVTASDKTTWNGKQDAISDLATIRSNASSGASAYTTIQGYGNIVTHNASEFATSAQGALADTALQSGDNVSELVNDAGYITGITGSDVTTALGYTPYNSSNPSGYQANVIESIKVNGTAQTITAKAVDITVPTKTSDITNDSGFITSSALAPYALSADLATVATSGDYDDLSNKPTIPTVGNGTITITQGGMPKGTFTTNQSGNTTIELDAGGGGGSYTAGDCIDITGNVISIDTGNATSTTKEAIVRWGLPDYDNPISISTFNSSHPYTATKDGLFKAVTGTSVELYVNGAEAYYGGVSNGGQAWAMTAFVSKGDIITTDASSTVRVQLFPLKGVA